MSRPIVRAWGTVDFLVGRGAALASPLGKGGSRGMVRMIRARKSRFLSVGHFPLISTEGVRGRWISPTPQMEPPLKIIWKASPHGL